MTLIARMSAGGADEGHPAKFANRDVWKRFSTDGPLDFQGREKKNYGGSKTLLAIAHEPISL